MALSIVPTSSEGNLFLGIVGKRILAGAAIVLLSMFELPALAQQTCGQSLSQCDLQQERSCLQKYYAWGEFDKIVQTLFVETKASRRTRSISSVHPSTASISASGRKVSNAKW